MAQLNAVDRVLARRACAVLTLEFTSDIPEDVPQRVDYDFGLYHPRDYVIRAWEDKAEHGIYPNGLPFDLQEQQLILDFTALDIRQGYWFDQIRSLKEQGYKEYAFIPVKVKEDSPEPVPSNSLINRLKGET